MNIDHEFLIVGAGLGGIGAGMYLNQHAFPDFAILEGASEIGGTWRDNIYPGVAADIPVLYFSFRNEPRSYWSSFYPPQEDLFRYCKDLIEKHNLGPKIRLNAIVAKSEYDVARNVWITHLAGGDTVVSRYLITATGGFSVPKLPDIPGIETFKGDIFHTTAWPKNLDMAGRQTAIIGTGATGVQIIPEIAEVVSHLDVYQRTPTWVLPKPNMEIGPGFRWAVDHIPGLHRLIRWISFGFIDLPLFGILNSTAKYRPLQRYLTRMCIRYMERCVLDPEMRKKLTPTFDFGCRRPTFSKKYFHAFSRPNVDLITTQIKEIRADAVVTTDGVERRIDTLVCATGFNHDATTTPTYPVYGMDGENLVDYWRREGGRAFRGVSIPSFPNLFMIAGPFSVASLSWINMIENSLTHMMRVLERARRLGANFIRVKQEAADEFFDFATEGTKKGVFQAGNCAGSVPGGAPPGTGRAVGGLRSTNARGAWSDTRKFSVDSYEYETKPTGGVRPMATRLKADVLSSNPTGI